MRRTPFNDGWTFRPKVDRFAEMSGAGGRMGAGHPAPRRRASARDRRPMPARRPGTSPAASGSTAGPSTRCGGRRHDDARVRGRLPRRDRLRERRVAGHRPYGYSGFAVAARPPAHGRRENEIRVDATAHEDSRWYSGARHLPERLAPRGRAGPPRARRRRGAHPRGRRRRRGRRGRDGRPEPAAR